MYLLYVYDAEGRQIAPPLEISADNDEAATEQAEKMKKYLMVFAPNCGMVIDWSFGSQAKSSGSFKGKGRRFAIALRGNVGPRRRVIPLAQTKE